MHSSKRYVWFMALMAIVVVGAACGGQAAEEAPAPEAAPAEEPVAAPAPEPEPMPVEEAPAEPAQQMLQGEIVEIESEHAMDWTTAATRETPGKYYWVVQLRNDTTQTLDITVMFDFLNEAEGVIKTDNKTERLQPAGTATFRVEGEMQRDDARAVVGYTYTWDYEIVSGS